jgi:hypothetical protein
MVWKTLEETIRRCLNRYIKTQFLTDDDDYYNYDDDYDD